MKSGVVKPGEIRILEALLKEDLRDKDIAEKAKLAGPTRRVKYLKNLWINGLITRDIYTRKYSISPRGREMLRLVDERKLVEDRMKTLLEEKEVVDISRGKVNSL